MEEHIKKEPKPQADASLVEELEKRLKITIGVFEKYDDGPSKMITGHCKDILKIIHNYHPAPQGDIVAAFRELVTRIEKKEWPDYEDTDNAQYAADWCWTQINLILKKHTPALKDGREGK